MNLFGLYRKLIWPIQRRLVSLSPRCPRCVLQSEGVCEACLAYKPIPEPPEAELRWPCNAVMLMSGGKDSAYVLNRLVNELPPMGITAITVDNGFIDQGVRNAAYCCEKLGVDHLIIRTRKDDFLERYRESLSSYKNAYETFDWADGELIFKIAQEYADGKPIICGISREQAWRIAGLQGHEHKGFIFPLAVWNPSEEEIYRVVEPLLPKWMSHTGVTNNRLIPILCALDVIRNGFCSFEPEFASLVRQGKADRTQWLEVFQLLEYSAKHGWFDKQIEDMMKEIMVH